MFGGTNRGYCLLRDGVKRVVLGLEELPKPVARSG